VIKMEEKEGQFMLSSDVDGGVLDFDCFASVPTTHDLFTLLRPV